MSALDRPRVDDDATDDLPSLEEVEARFAKWRNAPPPPWLTPEGLAAMAEAVERGVPELNGPLNADDLPEAED